MIQPSVKQLQIRNTEALDLLVVAPAGCGKTEALALRIQGLLERGVGTSPRKILVITFSNRARDNIKERLAVYLSPTAVRDRVTVTNFHGLAARLFRAHANVISMDPEMLLPEDNWVGEQISRRGIGWDLRPRVEQVLRESKQEARTDDEVAAFISKARVRDALDIETQRRDEGRLTYDDLPRVAELILGNDAVASLYEAHFAAVVVDEFQDLTPQQLRIVNRLGYKRTTYGGDLAQGIYGFAGARPENINRAIEAECGTKIEFAESHRSSPAVLAMVNSLTPLTKGTALTSAVPDSWPSGGIAGRVSHSNVEAEADWVVRFARSILESAPQHRIGVIARTAPRRAQLDDAFAASGLEAYRWDDGMLDTDTAKRVRALLATFSMASYEQAADKVEMLRTAARFEEIADADGRKNLAESLAWVADLLDQGVSPGTIRNRIRVGDVSTLLTVSGVHLLTGHVGKGQQFDWVVVAGLEEDILPDFRATTDEAIAEEARVLSVMISRARHGVVVSTADVTRTAKGAATRRQPSRFLKLLAAAQPSHLDEMRTWFADADWTAIRAR